MDTTNRRLVSAFIGSIAIGIAINWLVGVGVFFLFASIAPNDYPREWFTLPTDKIKDD